MIKTRKPGFGCQENKFDNKPVVSWSFKSLFVFKPQLFHKLAKFFILRLIINKKIKQKYSLLNSIVSLVFS